MVIVGLKVLKNRLSEYIRIAAGGETVLVTDRDRVVAELGPPQQRAYQVSDALLADAMRRGVVSPPLMVREAPPPTPGLMPLAELLGGLGADREDR